MTLHRGKLALSEVEIGKIRSLTRDELDLLREKRPQQPIAKRLRDPHHQLARLIAMGHDLKTAAALSGYSYSRAAILNTDPAFTNLVASYRDKVTESWVKEVDIYHELAVGNMLKAERHLAERIEEKEEAGELLTVKEALAISRDAADRFGYGKKSTNVNVNIDFATRLEKARARTAKVIDSVSASSPANTLRGQVPSDRPAPTQLRRRA